MAKIAVAVYSTYGHILALAKAEAEGVKSANVSVDVFQLPSGEPHDASASSDLPILTPSKLAEYDGVLFGIPSRFGTHPYAFKAFFDATGAQWAQGAFYGKYAGFFVTSGTQGGGQESVIRNSVTILAHHGMLYVPLGYAHAFSELTNLTEVHGGSPWGAGSFAGPSGARSPSEIELHTARVQGKTFAETVKQSSEKSSEKPKTVVTPVSAPAKKSADPNASGNSAGDKSEPTAPVKLREPEGVAGIAAPDSSAPVVPVHAGALESASQAPPETAPHTAPHTGLGTTVGATAGTAAGVTAGATAGTTSKIADHTNTNAPTNKVDATAGPTTPPGSPGLARGENALLNAKNRAETNFQSGLNKAEDDYEEEPTKEKQKAESKFDKAIHRAEDRLDNALERAEERAEKRVEDKQTPAKGAVNEGNTTATEKEKSGCCKCM